MISPKFFIDTLGSYGIDFFAGVPDSLLKNICAYIADNKDARHNVIAANEGAAVGLAAGYHLATGKIGVVYMQNSGEGNIINPLASLTDKEVYNIPVLLLIGWRGRPGVHDEPQHVKQGKVTTGILNTMGVNYDVLCKEEDKAAKQIAKAVKTMKETGEVYALVIEKDTFEDYKLQSVEKNDLTMSREEAIQTVAAALGAGLTTCFEQPGVLSDRNDPSSVIPFIDKASYASLKARGIVADGMIPKLDQAFDALAKGAAEVRICHSSALLADGGTLIR